MNKAPARDVVDNVFATIGEALANGEDVSILGFGTFAAKISWCRLPGPNGADARESERGAENG